MGIRVEDRTVLPADRATAFPLSFGLDDDLTGSSSDASDSPPPLVPADDGHHLPTSSTDARCYATTEVCASCSGQRIQRGCCLQQKVLEIITIEFLRAYWSDLSRCLTTRGPAFLSVETHCTNMHSTEIHSFPVRPMSRFIICAIPETRPQPHGQSPVHHTMELRRTTVRKLPIL